MKISSLSIGLGIMLLPGLGMAAVGSSQVVQVKGSLGIPGGTLKSGTFTFSVEDQLSDRTIVRVTDQKGSKHYLLLAVPTQGQEQADSDGFSYFDAGKGAKRSIRTWKCSGCASAVEFVYPKLQAVKITDGSTAPVLAVDPTYDKLPANLSADDMKVVTLWTLSPQRISGDKGKGVKAVKYVAPPNAPANTNQVASAPAPPPPATPPPATTSSTDGAQATPPPAAAPAPTTTQVAQSAPPPVTPTPAATPSQVTPEAPQVLSSPGSRMPKTASNTYSLALYGMILLAGALTLRAVKARRS